MRGKRSGGHRETRRRSRAKTDPPSVTSMKNREVKKKIRTDTNKGQEGEKKKNKKRKEENRK